MNTRINLFAQVARGIPLPPAAAGYRWVYILSYGDKDAVTKIGIATDLKRRLGRYASRRIQYQIRLHSAYRVPASVAQRVETRTHASLSGWQLWGQHDQFLVRASFAEATLIDAIWSIVGKNEPLVSIP